MPLINVLFLSYFFFILIYSAYTDIMKGKIDNWITYPAIILGILFRFIQSGPSGFLSALFGAATGFIFMFIFFAAGGIGAGDVKLMTAVGAFGGWYFLLWTLFFTAWVGFFVAIFMLLIKGKLWSGIKRTFLFLKNIFLPTGKKISLADDHAITVPFGAVIVVGAYMTFFMVGI
ncbi:MAG: prepilin peptidase [Candidatus Aureabacteria bacterium]|nr:prepilin peptidase [Candidatus Auribacterota bacterium]